jgi:hypothetical protein
MPAWAWGHDFSCTQWRVKDRAVAMARSAQRTRGTTLHQLLNGIVLFQGVSGVGGGIGLLVDPTGALLGIPLTWLDGSPFTDYFLPGLILLVALGVFPLLVSWGLWKYRRWAWYGSIAVGITLITWILVEVIVVGYQADPPLQAVYGTLGVIILWLSLARRVRVVLVESKRGPRPANIE